MTPSPDRQDAAERLALVLTEHGLQRMTARVLATLLFTEKPTMTMGELAESLQASAGAISAAVKMLVSVGLVERVPMPASRRDHYRLRDNAWAVLFTNQNAVVSAMQAAAEAGVAATAPNGLARQRLTQMRDFYAFLGDSGALGPLAQAGGPDVLTRRTVLADGPFPHYPSLRLRCTVQTPTKGVRYGVSRTLQRQHRETRRVLGRRRKGRHLDT